MPGTDFNTWFPTSRHGDPAINVMDFGAYADGTGHSMTSLGFTTLANAQNGVGGNGKAYPSATALSDYADWCAITAAVRAAFTEDGVRHEGEGYKNRPLKFPAGLYRINKPIDIVGVSHALIYATGNYTQIYNETSTAPNNICFKANGLRYSHIENINFAAIGTDCIAFDLNSSSGETVDGQPVGVMSHGNMWVGCVFNADGGTGCWMGRGGYMGSEQTFIRCTADHCHDGWKMTNFNALTYVFMTCMANYNTNNAIKAQAGGEIVCINCAFSSNESYDIENLAGSPMVLINTRTESRKFVSHGARLSMIGCSQGASSSETIFLQNGGEAHLTACYSSMGRLEGAGNFTIDGCMFGNAAFFITSVTNSGGLVKITHPDLPEYSIINPITGLPYHWEHWLDGDQVKIINVIGTTNPTAPSVNGTWIIHKLDKNNFELVGSNYFADTYNVSSGPAQMYTGPRFYITQNPKGRISATAARNPHLSINKNFQIKWIDSGTTFDNFNATSGITLTLPSLYDYGHRGAYFRFVVLTAQPVTIATFIFGDPATLGLTSRIFRAGGYATAGTQITCSTIGASLELYLADDEDMRPASDTIGHRWLVRAETGTWTISGTPLYD